MSAQHTPGPWYFETTEDPSELHGIAIRDSYHLFLAGVEPHHETVADPIANARLIAAAPELLAALRECEQFLAVHADAHNLTHPETNTQRRLATVRAAIAKAEGTSVSAPSGSMLLRRQAG